MENNEQTVENLENLTTEQLEELENSTEESQESIDYKAKAEAAEKRAAILQRLLDKKNKTVSTTKTNLTSTDLEKDVQEIKLNNRIQMFAQENGLSLAQSKRIFEAVSNPTAETLKDPFYAEGLKAIARKERVEDSTPKSGRVGTVAGKSFNEMSMEERESNFTKAYGLDK